ncbi:MAG: hypothetical protein V7767_11125, partial [Leeuwenhoekiella sp.]
MEHNYSLKKAKSLFLILVGLLISVVTTSLSPVKYNTVSLRYHPENSFIVGDCNAISPFDCSEIGVGLPVELNFNESEIIDAGFTMVDPPSNRNSADASKADPEVLGLINENLTISNGFLILRGSKGTSDRFSNSQMNALGVGIDVEDSGLLNISTTFLQPDFSATSGNNDQHAGIWFGIDEDHFVKLVIIKNSSGWFSTTQRVQLILENRKNDGTIEIDNISTSSFRVSSLTDKLNLRIQIDPDNLSVKGFYSLNADQEILVQNNNGSGSLTIPQLLIDGKDHDQNPDTAPLSFSGIIASVVSASTNYGYNNKPFDISYDSFSVLQENTQSSDNDIVSFVLEGQIEPAQIDTKNHSVTVIVNSESDLSNLSPDIEISSNAVINPLSGSPNDFSNPFTYTVTAENGTSQKWIVNISTEVKKELNFSSSTLSFSGDSGSSISSQMVMVSASDGSALFSLSEDPDSSDWLVLPASDSSGNYTSGSLEIGIRPNLAEGIYRTTLIAIDQSGLGYGSAELPVELEITPGKALSEFVAHINFQDKGSVAPW